MKPESRTASRLHYYCCEDAAIRLDTGLLSDSQALSSSQLPCPVAIEESLPVAKVVDVGPMLADCCVWALRRQELVFLMLCSSLFHLLQVPNVLESCVEKRERGREREREIYIYIYNVFYT